MQNKPLPPNPRANACRDRTGQYFRSQKECAFANDVSEQTLLYHLRTHGNLDRMGQGRAIRYGNRNGAKPVTINGWTWATQLDLANYLGVDKMTVSRWVRQNQSERMLQALYRADMQHGTIHRRQA